MALHPEFANIFAGFGLSATVNERLGSFLAPKPASHPIKPEQGEQAAAELSERMAAELGEVAS